MQVQMPKITKMTLDNGGRGKNKSLGASKIVHKSVSVLMYGYSQGSFKCCSAWQHLPNVTRHASCSVKHLTSRSTSDPYVDKVDNN